MSTIILEKVTTPLESPLRIVTVPMKKAPKSDPSPYDPSQDPEVRERLREYVSEWMEKTGLTTAIKVEARAKKLQISEGVSDATVGNILGEKAVKMSVYSLRNLAVTLTRHPKEMFLIAIGEKPEKAELEELESLAQIHDALPESERVYLKRRLQGLIKEMSSES